MVHKLKSGPGPGWVNTVWLANIPHYFQFVEGNMHIGSQVMYQAVIFRKSSQLWNSQFQELAALSSQVSQAGYVLRPGRMFVPPLILSEHLMIIGTQLKFVQTKPALAQAVRQEMLKLLYSSLY